MNASGSEVMTKQEAMDIVAEHLLRQGCKALGAHGCFYRIGELKCAVGALIPDELYQDRFENMTLANIMRALPQIFGGISIWFLGELQHVHDGSAPVRWPLNLRNVCTEHSLHVPQCVTDALLGEKG